MHLSFQITAIDDAPFISHWSSKYRYPEEGKYTNNIGKPLTTDSLRALFEWKNGTGDEISPGKVRSIVENYPLVYEGDKVDRYLNHRHAGGAV